MKQRIPVGSKVRATAKYASECDDLPYINSVGELMKDDGSATPYHVVYEDQNEFHWFRESELELAEEPVDEKCNFDHIKFNILEIMDGRVFYTEQGSKIHLKKGVMLLNEEPLDLRKILDVRLSRTNPLEVPPFEIDPVKFAHCKVWDNNENNGRYTLVTKYTYGNEYPFTTISGSTWKNAKLV